MTALPSPSGSTSGPQRPDPETGSSRHSFRPADTGSEAAGHDAHDDHDEHDRGEGAWFAVVLRGYDRGQVDARLAELDRRIHEEMLRAEAAEETLSETRARLRRLEEQVAGTRTDDEGFGRRVERVLQAAEQEAAELRERARADAEEIVGRAREEAEDRRTRTEEALLERAATLDREITSRSGAVEEREETAARREAEATERLDSAREEADRILESARAEAEKVRSTARDDAARTVREAERDADERRTGASREVERLTALRDEVRGDLGRMREALTAELDRAPVTTTPDEVVFGSTGAGRPGTSTDPVPDPDTAGPSSGAPAAASSQEDDPAGSRSGSADEGRADGTDDPDGRTGTLLLGPGRRPGTERDDDPERTAVGQIPPISPSSIGVLPYGDHGTGSHGDRTRNDGSGTASRPHRGPTRGPGAGRSSR